MPDSIAAYAGPLALLATDSPKLRAMDRHVLRGKLPPWLWPLIQAFLKLLPVVLPLLLANRVAVRAGLADQPVGSPVPGEYDGAVAAAVEVARAAGPGDGAGR